MKRAFLVIGLAAGFGAAGQQQDMVDIPALIKKRMDETMQKHQPPDLLNKDNLTFHFTPGYDLKGSYLFTLPGGDQVYRLPTDNMPCVVPDNKLIYSMPVLRKNQQLDEPGKAGSIPNPGL